MDVTEVVSKYGNMLRNYGLSLGATLADVEDAIQETLIAHWQKPPDEMQYLGSRLKRILHNRLGDMRRKQMRRQKAMPTLSLDAVAVIGGQGYTLAEVIPQPEPCETPDINPELYKAIQRLKPAIAQTFMLYVDGRTHKEIAAELNISIGTVLSRINRVRAKLAKNMEYRKAITTI